MPKYLKLLALLLPALWLGSSPVVAAEPEMECGSHQLGETRCALAERGLIELVEQVSRAFCDEGRTWGYDAEGLWTKERCRAIFRIHPKYQGQSLQRADLSPPAKPESALPPQESSLPADQIADVYCASPYNRYQHCDANTRGRSMQLVHEFSDHACDYGRTWGYNSRGIWVDRGCIGLFRMKRLVVPPPRILPVRCEGEGNRRVHCPVQNLGYVELRSALSDSPCRKGEHWGVEQQGIWVQGDCRALFNVVERGTGLPVWLYGEFEGMDASRGETLGLHIGSNGHVRASRNDRPIHADIDGDLLTLGGEPYEIAKSRGGFRAESTRAARFKSIAFKRLD
ncbi:MAG: DUF3011 domain-containing protein [Gammaproteobacteria bacterium]|nr:DUF3011 domain-containing protein [Gammaproteobacteria bacterium]